MQPDEQRSDEELARGARAGDRDALEALLRRYQDPVYALCLRWLGSPRLAGAAARSALIDFAEHLRAPPAEPAILIYQHAVTACRRSERDGGGVLPAARGEDERSRLRRALRGLDDDELPVLLLRDLAGLDLDQIAEVLALSRGSARSRLQRARLRLGRLLEPEDDV